jgi:hypothetical protein
MAADSYLIERLQNALRKKGVDWNEKRMFGGVTFMVNDKMCFGPFRDGLMVRIDPDEESILLKKDHVEQMIMKNTPMKGYLIVSLEGIDREANLDFWVGKCLEFNPKAKASKKKKID